MKRFAVLASLMLWFSSAAAETILVIKNNSTPLYDDPIRVLNSVLGRQHRLKVVDLGGANTLEEARARTRASAPGPADLVVALGDKAAYLAEKDFGSIPYLFAMVASWEPLGLNRGRASGIAMQLEPETMASQIKTFLPGRQRIGVVYTDIARPFVERAMQKAASLQTTLIPVFVRSGEDFNTSMQAILPTVDLFWLVEDSAIVTPDNLKALREAARSAKVPVVTYSAGLVEGGLTMAITVDRIAVGNQLAAMVAKVFAGTSPAALPVEAPERSQVTLNRESISELGLQLDPMVRSFAQIVETRQDGGGKRPR
jgi:ABC-type uncharacterized transport system substrate-binding protein